MYIDAGTIIQAASLVTALGVLIGLVASMYKWIDGNKKQTEAIKALQEENTLLCYCVRSMLQSMIDMGANGPCHDALTKLDKHLNQTAHKSDI